MWYTELKDGQSITVGGATITMVRNQRNKVRLGIDADKSIKIEHTRKTARNNQQDA